MNSLFFCPIQFIGSIETVEKKFHSPIPMAQMMVVKTVVAALALVSTVSTVQTVGWVVRTLRMMMARSCMGLPAS